MPRKPKIKRAKFKWYETDLIPGCRYVNLTTGTVWFRDGKSRPLTDEELSKILS